MSALTSLAALLAGGVGLYLGIALLFPERLG